jgi:hypothetical protein
LQGQASSDQELGDGGQVGHQVLRFLDAHRVAAAHFLKSFAMLVIPSNAAQHSGKGGHASQLLSCQEPVESAREHPHQPKFNLMAKTPIRKIDSSAKHETATGLSSRHAKLAVGAAATLVMFLFETHMDTKP